jgi:hypothetical protein
LSPLFLSVLFLAAPPADALERRLVRTIQLGVADVEPSEILAHAKSDHADFVGHCLARAALTVLGRDEGFPEWPLEKLLDRQMSLLSGSANGNVFPPRPWLPEGFAGDDLALTLVYSLAVTGRGEQAVGVLEPRLRSKDEFVRGVALQALRNLGLPSANALVEQAGRAGGDRNLPENLLADLYYPFLADLQARLHLIPTEGRTRPALLEAAREGCGEKAALAVYFMGFLSDAPSGESPELPRLRELTRAPCFHTRYFAVRSLALRSPESPEFWLDLLRDTGDAWQRQQIVRAATVRLGRAFTAHSLALLEKEPVQYVQWELMQGFVETRRGARFRDLWDLWQPTTLVYRLYFSEGGESPLPPQDLEQVLQWLESGGRPRDPAVRNHLLYRLAGEVKGPDARRFLAAFAAVPDKTRHFWILAGLTDRSAAPLLRYWLTLPGEEDQHAELERVVERLERPALDDGAPGAPCCAPTAECLRANLPLLRPEDRAVSVTNEVEAARWLADAGQGHQLDTPVVTLVGPLGREAVVQIGSRRERYEHLYGCWRRTGADDR